MRFGLVVALLLSVVLISGASWWRFIDTGSETSTIMNLEQVNTEDLIDNEEVLEELTTPKPASISNTSSEPLTNTDVITRNLIMSYVTTAINSEGVVNSSTINGIADQYVNKTDYLHTFKSVSLLELSVIQDNVTNARNYAKEFSKIYSNYTWEITLISKNPNDLGALAIAYDNMSKALKALPVPISVSFSHLQLVNNHASTAAAIREMKEVQTDPVKTIAGLTAIKENVAKEASALADIDRILREKYGTL